VFVIRGTNLKTKYQTHQIFCGKSNLSDAKGGVKDTKELVDLMEAILYWKKDNDLNVGWLYGSHAITLLLLLSPSMS
jgi:hypothetical protein